jgi:hypothetical protein
VEALRGGRAPQRLHRRLAEEAGAVGPLSLPHQRVHQRDRLLVRVGAQQRERAPRGGVGQLVEARHGVGFRQQAREVLRARLAGSEARK